MRVLREEGRGKGTHDAAGVHAVLPFAADEGKVLLAEVLEDEFCERVRVERLKPESGGGSSGAAERDGTHLDHELQADPAGQEHARLVREEDLVLLKARRRRLVETTVGLDRDDGGEDETLRDALHVVEAVGVEAEGHVEEARRGLEELCVRVEAREEGGKAPVRDGGGEGEEEEVNVDGPSSNSSAYTKHSSS